MLIHHMGQSDLLENSWASMSSEISWHNAFSLSSPAEVWDGSRMHGISFSCPAETQRISPTQTSSGCGQPWAATYKRSAWEQRIQRFWSWDQFYMQFRTSQILRQILLYQKSTGTHNLKPKLNSGTLKRISEWCRFCKEGPGVVWHRIWIPANHYQVCDLKTGEKVE